MEDRYRSLITWAWCVVDAFGMVATTDNTITHCIGSPHRLEAAYDHLSDELAETSPGG